MPKPFQHIERFRPGRSVFDLSHYKIFDADMGKLIPVLAKRMVPGDHFKISDEIVIRMNPSVAPIMHEVNVYRHTFFVPLRLLWPKKRIPETAPEESGSWEEFFTGGKDGTLEPAKPSYLAVGGSFPFFSLGDYFGFPCNKPLDVHIDPWYHRAYNFIWNEYYRDQNYMDEVEWDQPNVLYRCWEKDYFTSALPWEQRGVAPALDIVGSTNAEFLYNTPNIWGMHQHNVGYMGNPAAFPNGITGLFYNREGYLPAPGHHTVNLNATSDSVDVNQYVGTNFYPGFSPNDLKPLLNDNVVNLTGKVNAFEINDLRIAMRTQEFLERNMRAGSRYTEQLLARYGTSPRDERLQRPEYVGGARSPLIVSEVLQTSSTDGISPQGNLAGHGMTVDRNRIGSYYAQEFGIIMTIMSIMPRPLYQQGLPRELLGTSRYDELIPEFVHLGEQPVYNAEIFAGNNRATNMGTFGFNGRYDEYRVAHNMVCGQLRNDHPQTLAFWHLGRHFANQPALNSSFLGTQDIRKDWLAFPTRPAFVVSYGNRIRAVRPLPAIAIPRT